VNGWSLVYEGFDPAQERLRESLCTLGNGYVATRGAAPESAAGPAHYPGTYFAGCYNRLSSVVDGRTLEHEDLVNAPNWLPLTFRRPGERWFGLQDVRVLSYRQELDLRRGVLLRQMRVRTPRDGRPASRASAWSTWPCRTWRRHDRVSIRRRRSARPWRGRKGRTSPHHPGQARRPR